MDEKESGVRGFDYDPVSWPIRRARLQARACTGAVKNKDIKPPGCLLTSLSGHHSQEHPTRRAPSFAGSGKEKGEGIGSLARYRIPPPARILGSIHHL